MRIPASLVLAAASLALVGCGHVRATGSQPSPVVVTAPTSASSTTVTSTSDVVSGSIAAQAEADGQFSLVVFDRLTGQAVMSDNPSAHYPAESVVKLLIAVTALEQGTDEDLVTSMLMRSDDQIANQLWSQYGNVAIIQHAIRTMGLPGVLPPGDPGHWGDTQITADDVVKIYQYILDRAPQETRVVIMKALGSTTRYAADSFDQYFGIPDAADGKTWAVKQGWACCKPDRVVHTTGVIGDQQRFIIAALSSHDASSSTWPQVTSELTEAMRRVLSQLKA
jgi:hypothetical protein